MFVYFAKNGSLSDIVGILQNMAMMRVRLFLEKEEKLPLLQPVIPSTGQKASSQQAPDRENLADFFQLDRLGQK